jgi:hypothetical protein
MLIMTVMNALASATKRNGRSTIPPPFAAVLLHKAPPELMSDESSIALVPPHSAEPLTSEEIDTIIKQLRGNGVSTGGAVRQ